MKKRVSAASLALAGLVIAAGCDETAVRSRNRSRCDSDADCPAGQVCEDDRCMGDTTIGRWDGGGAGDSGSADAPDAGGSDSATGTETGADTEPAPDTVAPDVSPVDAGADEWGRWGTTGSDGTPKSPEGYGMCNATNVRTDDLRGRDDRTVPPDPWARAPVADEVGRCGDDDETLIWRLVNCERMTVGLDPFACDLRLVWLARLHSGDMAARGYFDHVNPDGEDPFDRMTDHGVGYGWAGENIAYYWSAEEAHLGWMDSDGHRANILQVEFTHLGVGVEGDGGGGLLLTEEFIRP